MEIFLISINNQIIDSVYALNAAEARSAYSIRISTQKLVSHPNINHFNIASTNAVNRAGIVGTNLSPIGIDPEPE